METLGRIQNKIIKHFSSVHAVKFPVEKTGDALLRLRSTHGRQHTAGFADQPCDTNKQILKSQGPGTCAI